jgi:hypothetical protein
MDYCGVAQIEGLFEMNGVTDLEKAGVEFLAKDAAPPSVCGRARCAACLKPKKGK